MQKHHRFTESNPEIEERVSSLLARMSLQEKVGQMTQAHQYRNAGGLDTRIREGAVGSILSVTDVGVIQRWQRIAVEESRLGIPLLIGNDVIHGYRTIFPIPLAESCSWDMELIELSARTAADEAAANGTNWNFAPMVDIARDPRWGRIAEGAGEDPYLGAAVARARTRGFQAKDLICGCKISACVKHYAAYGAAEAGKDYNTVDISERTLREIYLPPFKAAFDEGAGSVMPSFNEISGLPSAANSFLLRQILRDEWKWHGVTLSDWNAIAELVPHGIASDLKDAARLSVLAGMDMDMGSGAYAQHLAELVGEGAVPESVLDLAVRRILRLKICLGLFENPFVDENLAKAILLRPDFRERALRMAHRSMVLLKNEAGLLPLRNDQKIALIGPLAENQEELLGCWKCDGRAGDVVTVLDGFRSVSGVASRLTCVKGCEIHDDRDSDFSTVLEVVEAADVAVLVMGESAGMSGEAHSLTRLGLPGRQQALLEAAVSTGKPVVLVLISGRPMVIPWAAANVPAILAAWQGGTQAGQAVADLLFGRVNPSAKLTASFPRSEGQIPVYYAHKNTGRPIEGPGTIQFNKPHHSDYLDELNSPLYPFGYGLSYTRYQYEDLRVDTPLVSLGGVLKVSAVIRNIGEMAGEEIVQLYVRDLVGSVTRPVRELKGFQRIFLGPGDGMKVTFEVPASMLGFYGLDLSATVEPGKFQVWVGPNSQEGLEGVFEIR